MIGGLIEGIAVIISLQDKRLSLCHFFLFENCKKKI